MSHAIEDVEGEADASTPQAGDALEFKAFRVHDANSTPMFTPYASLSDELEREIARLPEHWDQVAEMKHGRKKATERKKKGWKAYVWREAILQPTNQCAFSSVDDEGGCFWTKASACDYACRRCANAGRLCFRQHAGELWLLPLPAAVAESTNAAEVGFYRMSEQ